MQCTNCVMQCFMGKRLQKVTEMKIMAPHWGTEIARPSYTDNCEKIPKN